MKKRKPTLEELASEHLDDAYYRFITCDWSGVSLFQLQPKWSATLRRWVSSGGWKQLYMPPTEVDLSAYKYHGKVVFKKCIIPDIPEGRPSFSVWPEKEIYSDGDGDTACGLKADFPTEADFLSVVAERYAGCFDKENGYMPPTEFDVEEGVVWIEENEDISWAIQRRPRGVKLHPAWIVDLT